MFSSIYHNIFYLFLIFSAVLTISSCNKKNSEVVATVGSHEITLSEFEERYTNYLFSSGVKDNAIVRKSVLQSMIDEILLRNYDNNESVLSNPEYKKELTWIEKQAVLAYLKDREIYAKLTASDGELRQAFQRVNEKIAARHLYAETEEEADRLYQLLKAGVDFNYLAAQVFTDSTLKNNGGYLGYFTWGDMDPAFEEAAYSMKVGEISPPVKTEQGYSIIKLEGRTTNPLLTEYQYQTKKSKLERLIKIRKKEPAVKKYISNRVDAEKIKFNEESLKEVFNHFTTRISGGTEQITKDEKCMEYNDRIYGTKDILERIENLPYYHREKITSVENLKAVLKGFILQDELLRVAEEKGYDDEDEVLKMIEKMKTKLFMKYKTADITNQAELPDSVIHKFYEEHLDFFSTHDEVNVQEILVNNKKLAQSIINKLESGENFGELAQQYSLRESSARNNGVIGYAPISRFGILKDKFWNAKLNRILGPIEIEKYYGIFKVLDRQESKPLKFEKVKKEATLAAKYKKGSEIYKNYLNKLNEKTVVFIDKKLLNSFPINL